MLISKGRLNVCAVLVVVAQSNALDHALTATNGKP